VSSGCAPAFIIARSGINVGEGVERNRRGEITRVHSHWAGYGLARRFVLRPLPGDVRAAINIRFEFAVGSGAVIDPGLDLPHPKPERTAGDYET